MSDHKAAHKEIEDLFNKLGIVDGYYGGVFIDGRDISGFQVGDEARIEYSNVDRAYKLMGMMTMDLFSLQKKFDEDRKREKQLDIE
jgi:hypothetical protein